MAGKSEVWAKSGAKTRNLTAAEQKKAVRIIGGKRTEKVTATERKSAKATVDISGTKWMKADERAGKGRGGLLTDMSGKAITGTVRLPSGAMATYVRGKRIGVTGGRNGGGGNGNGGGGPKSSGGPKTPSMSSIEKLRKARNQDRMNERPSRPGALRDPGAPKPGEYQPGRGMGSAPSYGGAKRPIPYTSKGPYASEENRILNLINIEKQRIRQAQERNQSKAEAAKYQQRLRALESQLRALQAKK